MKKPSFFERLTGAAPAIDYDRVLNDDEEYQNTQDGEERFEDKDAWEEGQIEEPTPQEGELPVDMYQTHDTIVIRALVAGVSPNDMEISITRDMVTIRGMREEIQESADDNYYHRELFWGGFTRTLLLPEEVIIDEAEASEKHGLLEIRLPKLDKNRSTQLRVKTTVNSKS